MIPKSNNCVQATPGCALLFIVAQVPGAPDVESQVPSLLQLPRVRQIVLAGPLGQREHGVELLAL